MDTTPIHAGIDRLADVLRGKTRRRSAVGTEINRLLAKKAMRDCGLVALDPALLVEVQDADLAAEDALDRGDANEWTAQCQRLMQAKLALANAVIEQWEALNGK